MKTSLEDDKMKNRRDRELIETDKKIKQMVRGKKVSGSSSIIEIDDKRSKGNFMSKKRIRFFTLLWFGSLAEKNEKM